MLKSGRPNCAVRRSPARDPFEIRGLPFADVAFIFIASPANPAVPQNLAYREITESAGDAGRPEAGPDVERAGTRPRALLHLLPSGHRSGGFVHNVYFRDPCTVLHKRKISTGAEVRRNLNKSLLLGRNWLRSVKTRAGLPQRVCVRDASGQKPNRPPKTRILRPNGELVFPLHPNSAPPAPPRQFAWILVHNARISAIRAQRCTNPKPLPLPG
jgi:hypothetical protein